MADRPLKRADARDWKGMISAADPHDLPPDALQVLENMQILNRGELLGRAGYRRLGFLTGDTSNPSPSPVASMVNFQHPQGQYLVFQTDSGQIKAALLGAAMLVLLVLPTAAASSALDWQQKVRLAPSRGETILEDVRSDPCDLCPLYQRARQSPDLNQAIIPSVALLFTPGCPAAIFRLVVAVVVNSVDRVLAGRPRPHVRVEALEGVQPSLANSDSAPSVLRESRPCRPQASGLHVDPRSVFRALGSGVRGHQPPPKAAATLLFSFTKIVAASWALSTAVAFAAPADAATELGVATNDLESSKSLSDQVDQPRHLRAPRVNHMVIAQSPQKHKVV